MVAPLLPLAMMAMMPGMMPGMGLAMGAGLGNRSGGGGIGAGIGSAAKGYGDGIGSAFSGIGKGIGNIFGGGEQKSKDLKFDKVTISSVEIKDVSIGNLTIDSMDKDEGDLGKEEKDKGEIVDKTLTSDLEQQGSLTEKGLLGGMEDSLGNPIEGMTDSNAEMSEMLQGKSSFGGGFPELTEDTGKSVGWLESIADNTKILEDMFKWANKDEEVGQKGWWEATLSELNTLLANLGAAAWTVIEGFAKAAWTVIEGYAKAAWTVIEGFAKATWTVIEGFAKATWAVITDSLELAMKAFQIASTELREWTATLADIGVDVGTAVSGELRAWGEAFSTEVREWTKTFADIGINVGQAVGHEVRESMATLTDSFVKISSSITDSIDKLADTSIKLSEEGRNWMHMAGEGLGILDAEETNITVLVPFAKDVGGDVVALRDTLYDIRDILKDWSSWTMSTGNYSDPFADTNANFADFSMQNPVAVIPEDMAKKIVPAGNPEHLELTEVITQNVAEKAVSSAAAGQPKSGDNQGALLSSRQSSGFKDRDLDPQAHPTSPRGMTPSYTKAPPPPRGNSNTTIDEVRSYLKFPNWRTRMG